MDKMPGSHLLYNEQHYYDVMTDLGFIYVSAV